MKYAKWLAQFMPSSQQHRSWLTRIHVDNFLLVNLLILCAAGLFILYSASNQDTGMVMGQAVRFSMAFMLMFVLAQIPPHHIKHLAPWFYSLALLLLFIVLAAGAISKGAQRWLSLGLFRFQPSELMKLAVPLMLAWYLSEHPLPPRRWVLLISIGLIAVPALLVAKQPDLGTALLITCAGAGVIVLAGVRWRTLLLFLLLGLAIAPLLWQHLHDYQRQRVLTFLTPERDPLGAGYHIIQSKIAIGSGGVLGKGWLNGTQSHLQFLPEHATDFIFAVCGEELGLIGGLILMILYLTLILRGFYISLYAQDTFSRLLSGSISLTFFFSMFINMGMVTGILPVVGLPLPLVSYGGTSMLTLIAGFGLLMSIQTHRKLVGT
jgi:rod shape determining protein RodA